MVLENKFLDEKWIQLFFFLRVPSFSFALVEIAVFKICETVKNTKILTTEQKYWKMLIYKKLYKILFL